MRDLLNWRSLLLLAVGVAAGLVAGVYYFAPRVLSAERDPTQVFPFKVEGPIAAPKPAIGLVKLRCKTTASSGLGEMKENSDVLLAFSNDYDRPMTSILLGETSASLTVDGSGMPKPLPVVLQGEGFLVASGWRTARGPCSGRRC
jgi:hypothetical protein